MFTSLLHEGGWAKSPLMKRNMDTNTKMKRREGKIAKIW